MYHQPRTPDLFSENHLTSSKLGSKVWMHQRFAHPRCCFVVDLEGKWQHFFVGVRIPFSMECMKAPIHSEQHFGHVHCLKLFRCVYTKQRNHTVISKNLNKVRYTTMFTEPRLNAQNPLLICSSDHSFLQKTLFPVRFVQPKRLSALTGFLIPEHWHDGEVLVIGIPHFSKNLGPTWMVGNNHCQFSRHIPSNSIAWRLMLWWRVQPAYCPCLACI